MSNDFDCPECGRKYQSRRSLARHIKSIHQHTNDDDSNSKKPDKRTCDDGGNSKKPNKRTCDDGGNSKKPIKRICNDGGNSKKPIKRTCDDGGNSKKPIKRTCDDGGNTKKSNKRPCDDGGNSKKPIKRTCDDGGNSKKPNKRTKKPSKRTYHKDCDGNLLPSFDQYFNHPLKKQKTVTEALPKIDEEEPNEPVPVNENESQPEEQSNRQVLQTDNNMPFEEFDYPDSPARAELIGKFHYVLYLIKTRTISEEKMMEVSKVLDDIIELFENYGR